MDQASLNSETIVLARLLFGEQIDKIGGKRAAQVAGMALNGQDLPPGLSGSGGHTFDWKETLELVFGIAGFVKVLTDLWSVYGRQKTPKEKIDERFAALEIPESTKRKILNNQEYIVKHLSEKFPAENE